MTPKTEAGRVAEAAANGIIDALEQTEEHALGAVEVLAEHPDVRPSGEALTAMRTVVDMAADLHDVAERLATRLSVRLPRLEKQLKRLRRALDRAEGN